MNEYIIKNIEAVCLTLILYWGVNYKIDWIFWTATALFFIMFNLMAFVQRLEKEKSK